MHPLAAPLTAAKQGIVCSCGAASSYMQHLRMHRQCNHPLCRFVACLEESIVRNGVCISCAGCLQHAETHFPLNCFSTGRHGGIQRNDVRQDMAALHSPQLIQGQGPLREPSARAQTRRCRRSRLASSARGLPSISVAEVLGQAARPRRRHGDTH